MFTLNLFLENLKEISWTYYQRMELKLEQNSCEYYYNKIK